MSGNGSENRLPRMNDIYSLSLQYMKYDTLILNDPRFTKGLEGLRKVSIRVAAAAGIASITGYFAAIPLLQYLRGLAGDVTLVAFGVPETFFAVMKLSLVVGLTATMPFGLYLAMRELRRSFPNFSRRALIGYWGCSVLLFCIGVVFCTNVLLPYGTRFLLGFEGPSIAAFISVGKFVSFCSLLVLGMGAVFEMPLFMVLLARIGAVTPHAFAKRRRYAILAIFIVSAVLTPSPDVLNLMLMALPLCLLYEIGILGMRLQKGGRPPSS